MIMSPSYFSAEFVDQLGWMLVHSTWQLALIGLGAWALAWGLRRSTATVRYWGLLLPLSAMIAVPIVTWGWLGTDAPLEPVVETVSRHDVAETAPHFAPTVEPEHGSFNSVPQPVFVEPQPPPANPIKQVAKPQSAADVITGWRLAAADALRPWLAEFVLVWCVGVVLFALRPLLSWYTVRRLRTVGISAVPDGVQNLLQQSAQRLGLRQAVQVLQSTLVNVPVVVGCFRPVILLPMSLVTGLPANQLEAILAHELAHIRRHDYVVNLVQILIETVFFYHPAVWWLSRRIRTEREHCCDDLAVAALGNAVEYGRALLAVAELPGASTSLAMGVNDGSLLSRVQRIVGLRSDHDSSRSTASAVLFSLSLLAVVLAFSVMLSVAMTDETTLFLREPTNRVETTTQPKTSDQASTESNQPRFTDVIQLKLKRPKAHHGKWFFVDLDRGRLKTPPFKVVIDDKKLPYQVIAPERRTLDKWLTEQGVDLIFSSVPQPWNDGSGRMNQTVQTRSVRTLLKSVSSGLQPHNDGSWTWKTQPREVVALFARKDDTQQESGFVPNSSGGDIREDSPSLQLFRTAENVLGLYLLEQPDSGKDELRLRIVHVANCHEPLQDMSFVGQVVSGKEGVADPLQSRTDGKATISGRIVMEDGSPATVKGRIVCDSHREHSGTTSVIDNQFTDHFKCVVPAGTIWLSYIPDGFAPVWAGPFELKQGEQQADVMFVLKPGFSELVKLSNEQGKPIAGATIVAIPEINGKTNGLVIEHTTNAQGDYLLEHLADTRYGLTITAPSYQTLRTGPLSVKKEEVLRLKMIRRQPGFKSAGTARSSPTRSDHSAIWFRTGAYVHFVLYHQGFLQTGLNYSQYTDTKHSPSLWKFRGHINALGGKRVSDSNGIEWSRKRRFAIAFDHRPPGFLLSIDGKKYDLAAGRVFVLNAKGELTQLPIAPPPVSDRDKIDQVAKRIQQALAGRAGGNQITESKRSPIPPEKVLEFRFAVNTADADAGPRVSEDFLKRNNPKLIPKDSEAAKDREFAWFPIADPRNKDIVLPIEETRGENMRVALLANTRDHALLWDGTWHVEKCEVVPDRNVPDEKSSFVVALDEAGGRAFRRLTKAHLNQKLAIIVDGKIVAAPIVRGEISRKLIITGDYSRNQAVRLATKIRKGIPTPTKREIKRQPKKRSRKQTNRQSNAKAIPPLERRVSLKAKRMPLKSALADVCRQAGIPLDLDVESLQAAGLNPDEPVTITIDKEPLQVALLRLFRWDSFVGIYPEIRNGKLFISSQSARQERIRKHLPDWLKPLYTHGLVARVDDEGNVVSVTASGVMTDELLAKLKTLPKLRELHIETTKTITPAGLAHLAELTSLEKLSFYNVNAEGAGIGDAAIRAVQGLKSLRELRVSMCGTTDAGVKLLESMPQLTSLSLQEGRLTDTALASIGKLKRLKYLGLTSYGGDVHYGRMRFTATGIRHLAGLRELEQLHLVGHEVPADMLAFEQLTSLSLGGPLVSDACAARIAEHRHLESLILSYTSISDDGLKQIARIPTLRRLDIDSRVITDAGIEHLKRLPALEHLTLRDDHVTNESLRHLAEIKTLTRLQLYGSSGPGGVPSEPFPVEGTELINRGITITGVQQLKTLPNLRTLWLSNFRSPEGYLGLKELKHLRSLVFTMSDISALELDALEEALPSTVISGGSAGGLGRGPKRLREALRLAE